MRSTTRTVRRSATVVAAAGAALAITAGAASAHDCFIPMYSLNGPQSANWEALTAQDGMEQPITHWTPSIAVCGMDFYFGREFPRWNGNLFVTALAQQELRRVVLDGHRVLSQEVLFKNIGRVRDVCNGPDGLLYVA